MNKKFPHQNSEAEGATGLNEKMEDGMKIHNDSVAVSDIENFIIGDIFNIENENFTLLHTPPTTCLLCR